MGVSSGRSEVTSPAHWSWNRLVNSFCHSKVSGSSSLLVRVWVGLPTGVSAGVPSVTLASVACGAWWSIETSEWSGCEPVLLFGRPVCINQKSSLAGVVTSCAGIWFDIVLGSMSKSRRSPDWIGLPARSMRLCSFHTWHNLWSSTGKHQSVASMARSTLSLLAKLGRTTALWM